MNALIENICSCFLTEQKPEIRYNERYKDLGNGRYVLSIYTDELHRNAKYDEESEIVLKKPMFNIKKFHELYPDYDIDCWCECHFMVFNNGMA